jgi:hypothetical protein
MPEGDDLHLLLRKSGRRQTGEKQGQQQQRLMAAVLNAGPASAGIIDGATRRS